MRIDPAHIDQVKQARNGRMITVSADVGGVAAALKEIDPGLKVRFAENATPPFWAVYWESEDQRHTELVLTRNAWQGNTGVWHGLDQSIVDRIMEIDREGRGGYDYALELEAQQEAVRARRRSEFRERVGGTAEEAAFALRKDRGVKNRAYIKRNG